MGDLAVAGLPVLTYQLKIAPCHGEIVFLPRPEDIAAFLGANGYPVGMLDRTQARQLL